MMRHLLQDRMLIIHESDRLGVITRALFAQRDFSDMSILDDFYSSLEHSLRGQLTESGLYMGMYTLSARLKAC